MPTLPDTHPRRILSLWFPRLAAERVLRIERGRLDQPLAVVAELGNTRLLSSVTATAQRQGLHRNMPLRDALAICPELVTRSADPAGEAAFLAALRRWAGKFSPWISEEAPDALVADLTGCAHLFGGEPGLLAQVQADCADLGLTVCAGLADTLGAAWALARHAGTTTGSRRSGDAIDQEARATRSRAGKRRHWTRGGDAPPPPGLHGSPHRIAAPGHLLAAIGGLPVAGLRLSPEALETLNRFGLRRIEDLAGMSRAALARRVGASVVLRLDQALGRAPEAVSSAAPPVGFAMRLTLPDPIGLPGDIEAAIDRLIPPLAAKLARHGRGARRLRLELMRTDQKRQVFELGLARVSAEADRMRPLLRMKIDQIDPGFGIDMVRLEAVQTEPVSPVQHRGHLDAGRAAQAQGVALDDLIGRLGARIGLEAITRRHPGDSHIPEKSAQILAAAWSGPARAWPAPVTPRPLVLFAPEPVHAADIAFPPDRFRWRGRDHALLGAQGPERVAPEWWLDDPAWRSGLRDYWRITTARGERLWLYYAHGGAMSGGWFCHGIFA